MQLAPSTERAPKRADGRGKHLWQANRKAAPRQIGKGARSNYGQAGESIYAWSIYGYPGLIEGLRRLNGRASSHAIRDWIRGRRKAPQWAWILLASAIERRIGELQHALALAKKEAGL